METVAIGTVRTAWGLKGWLKIKSFSGEWAHFFDLKSVILKARNRDWKREYQVEGFRMQHEGGLIKLTGVDSPEAGKILAGYEIQVPRDSGAPLIDNEWYLSDLVGLSLVDVSGTTLGEIISIIESSDDLLEIRKPDGNSFLVPFRSLFVGEPDIENGTLVLTAIWLME